MRTRSSGNDLTYVMFATLVALLAATLLLLVSGCIAQTPLGTYDCLWSPPNNLTCTLVQKAQLP